MRSEEPRRVSQKEGFRVLDRMVDGETFRPQESLKPVTLIYPKYPLFRAIRTLLKGP